MKDKERYLFSAGLTIVFYLLLFVLIDVFNFLKIEDMPEYYGPMTIELDDSMFETAQGESAGSMSSERASEKTEKKESFRDLMERFIKPEKKEDASSSDLVSKRIADEMNKTSSVNDNAEKVDDAFKVEKAEKTDLTGTEENGPVKSESGSSDLEKEESLFDDSVYSDLDSLIADSSKKTASEKADADKNGSGSSSSNFEFEGLPSERSLIPPVASPKINNSDLSKLPGTIYIVLSCYLTENGFLTALNIDKDSGYPQIAASVLEAVRTWHFEKAPGAGNIKLKIRYKITVR